MVMTAFKAHFTDGVTAAMLIGHTGVVTPFESILRERWEDHVVKVMKDTGDEANNNPGF